MLVVLDSLATTAINVEEIHRGQRPGEERAVGALFDGLVILPVTRAAAEIAGGWRRELTVEHWPAGQ